MITQQAAREMLQKILKATEIAIGAVANEAQAIPYISVKDRIESYLAQAVISSINMYNAITVASRDVTIRHCYVKTFGDLPNALEVFRDMGANVVYNPASAVAAPQIEG